MESRPEQDTPASPRSAPPDRQLPPGGSLLGRVTEHTQALAEDLTAWVELRIALAKIEFWETVDEKANQVAVGLITAVLGALAGLMMLFVLSFFFAWLWSFTGMGVLPATMLGFLVTAVLLGLLAVIVRAASPDLGLVPASRKRAQIDEKKVSRGTSAGRTSAAEE